MYKNYGKVQRRKRYNILKNNKEISKNTVRLTNCYYCGII